MHVFASLSVSALVADVVINSSEYASKRRPRRCARMVITLFALHKAPTYMLYSALAVLLMTTACKADMQAQCCRFQ